MSKSNSASPQAKVIAVVLTYRRARLATTVVRGLIQDEGFDPADIILVVNGEGGLHDPSLLAQIQVEVLPENLGPAGGFRAGLEAAARRGADWIYLCEDDVGLFDLPTPRVRRLIEQVELLADDATIGGVVAYGRFLDRRTGRTYPAVPGQGDSPFLDVDAAAWGASLVRADVIRQGILPDPSLFFGFEDFDFWWAMKRAGYRLLLDVDTAQAVAERVFHEHRDAALVGERPVDAEEPWRRYYEARNFMTLRRRYGRPTWTLWHIPLTFRRAYLSPTWAHRRAAVRGLVDGLLGRTGRNARYLRGAGERRSGGDLATGRILQVITDNDRRGGQVFATDLEVALRDLGSQVRTVALAPASQREGLHHDVLGPTRRHPTTLRSLRREIRDCAVVIAHGSTTLPMCAIAGLGLGKPFVYRQISEQLFWANTAARRLRTRAALRRTQHVVALWKGAADVLAQNFSVHPTRISVIPNGVPATRCPEIDTKSRLDARRRFGLRPEAPVLLSIGAFVPEKGILTLIRAMASPLLSEWQLLVVGAGPQQEEIVKEATRLPTGRVTIHGPVKSVAEAIAAADVIGLTSRGGDSMPAVLIEAGMMGVPAVATPIEGIVDIVLDGITGRIVQLDDAIDTASAINEVGKRTEYLGKSARDHCLRIFEMEHVARQWQGVLQRERFGKPW